MFIQLFKKDSFPTTIKITSNWCLLFKSNSISTAIWIKLLKKKNMEVDGGQKGDHHFQKGFPCFYHRVCLFEACLRVWGWLRKKYCCRFRISVLRHSHLANNGWFSKPVFFLVERFEGKPTRNHLTLPDLEFCSGLRGLRSSSGWGSRLGSGYRLLFSCPFGTPLKPTKGYQLQERQTQIWGLFFSGVGETNGTTEAIFGGPTSKQTHLQPER